MKVTNIQYGKSYELQGYWEKVSIDIQVDENEAPNLVLDHAKEIVDKWHKENNPDLYGGKKMKINQEVPYGKNEAIENEFLELKNELDKIEFREDAQTYLDTTDWKLAIEAKALVNYKPFKTK
ncbi:MAG: hypothetical protein ABI091_14785 [Ferruginibacter sp.]